MNEHDVIGWLKRAKSQGNYFNFFRDYLHILSRNESLFLQDLINHSSMREDEDGWFQCTSKYLWKSLMWTDKEQGKLFRSLKKKGYVKVKLEGLPATRFVWIDILKLERDLDKIQSPHKSANQYSPKRLNQHSAFGLSKKDTTKVVSIKRKKAKPAPASFNGSFGEEPILPREEVVARQCAKKIKNTSQATVQDLKKLIREKGEDAVKAYIEFVLSGEAKKRKGPAFIASGSFLREKWKWIKDLMKGTDYAIKDKEDRYMGEFQGQDIYE